MLNFCVRRRARFLIKVLWCLAGYAAAGLASSAAVEDDPVKPGAKQGVSAAPATAARVQARAAKGKNKARAESAPQWVWRNPEAPAGTQHKTFRSATLKGEEVSYLLWTPPGYDPQDTTKRYPVAYFLHGGGGGYTHIPETFLPQAAEAIRAGTLPPFLGIVVNGLPQSFYADSQDGRTPVESILLKDLLPHVDATYPTSGVRLIEGFSMGGRGATYLAFKYPDKFRGVADFAGAIHDWGFFSQMQVVAQLFEGEQAFNEAWPFNLARRSADSIRSHFPAGALIVVGDRDTGRGNTYQWNVKLHETLDELKIPNELRVVKDVRHSYELLAADPEAAKKHLAYYAAVFGAQPAAGAVPPAGGQEFAVHTFQRRQLTDVYYSEGIAAGDLNRDGQVDIVYGPYWFAGPSFQEKHEIYPAKAQPRERYADHFFAWVYDFNGDGWNDVFTVGFPGTPAYVYENPRAEGHNRPWPKHQVFDSVANESPHFTNLVGDVRPELVCTHDGFFGYATIDFSRPFEAWHFHPVSEKIAPVPFGHGLGVGDVNGDGRLDILMKDGWFAQPEKLEGSGRWAFQRARFAPIGGAEMYAYDVDGDGDNDVITSLAAHDFGLAWHEQVRDGNEIAFRQHVIMGDQPAHNRYGLVFSEPHSVNLADIDGDGLKDIVTGKTYWSHHTQSPLWDAGAVVYWFRLVRTKDGVDWVPYQADGEAGIGRQVIVQDIDGDGLLDLASGGMKGAHVLLHHRESVNEARWKELQPKVYMGSVKPPLRGKAAVIDEKSGRVSGALEAEELTVLKATAGKTARQKMSGFRAGRWSGDEQLLWSGATPGDRLELELAVPKDGTYDVIAAFTMARDFGIVQLTLDEEPLGEPLDLYNYPDVIASGEITLGQRKLNAGTHRLIAEIKGANASAVKTYLVGLDYVRLVPR